mmetsp:Transcript_11574/g.34930  ORF Transcript_11574/g.34930 Transcript_11574/m.34930 type:complete len:141 (-) Transcript_11574:83-505(-)
MHCARRPAAQLGRAAARAGAPAGGELRLCCRPLHLSARRSPSAHVYFPAGPHDFGVVKGFPRKEGEAVSAGDVVAEVESGPQQLLEVATPRSGEVSRYLRKKGEIVRAGDPLVEIHVTFAEHARGWWRTIQEMSAGGKHR